MTGFNVVLFLTVTYRAVHYMESVSFCGQTCHTVMQPEYTSHETAAHARVPCVDCHIGPGASWFVRSKLSGSYQVLAVAFDLYPAPDPRADREPAAVARHLRAVSLAGDASSATSSS